MPMISGIGQVVRPVLNLFYVLDTSGSMKGDPIGVLNRAMEETIDAVRDEALHNSNALVKVSVLEFNTNCRWVNPRIAESIDDFLWDDLSAGGNTYLGTALSELDRMLSRKGFLNSATGTLMPVVIFMTDGFANDNCEKELEKLWQNKWYAKGTRIAFAIGKNPDTELMAKLTGSSESVIRTRDLGLFAQLLRWVSVSATTLSSETHTREDALSGGDVLDEVFAQHPDVDRRDVSAGFFYDYDPPAADEDFDDSFFVDFEDFDASDQF